MPSVANFLRKRSIVLLMAESENLSSLVKIRSAIVSILIGWGADLTSECKMSDSFLLRDGSALLSKYTWSSWMLNFWVLLVGAPIVLKNSTDLSRTEVLFTAVFLWVGDQLGSSGTI